MSLFLTVGAMAQTAINSADFDPTKTYRIYNKAEDKGDTGWKAMSYINSKGCLKPYDASDETQKWQIISLGENGYRIYNVSASKYFAAVEGNNGVLLVDEASAATYHIDFDADGKRFAFWHSDANPRNYLWNDGSNNLYGWKEGTHELWYLEEVVEKPTYETVEVGNPTEDGVYRIYWKQNNRGYLAYHPNYPTKGVLADVTLGSYGSSHFNSATDPVELEWYLITSGNNKYLFNATNGKFLTYSEESADAAKAAYLDAARPLPITIEANTSHNGYYIIKANVDGRDCLLSSGCGTPSRTGYPVRWNSNISGDMGDGGSPLIFVKVNGYTVDPTIKAKAEAAIDDYENPVESNIQFQWTTGTDWQEVSDYTSTVLNNNALSGGIKCIEGDITIGGARTATVTFAYTTGSCALNVRGVEVVDAFGYIVAGDYHVGKAGSPSTDNVYTVKVAEAGTYTVRCYATFDSDNRANATNGTITVAFDKLNVIDLTKEITFAADYATLYLGYKVAIPTGVEAYVVSDVNSTWVELTQLHDVIPANTAVILKRTSGNTHHFYYTSDNADDVETNYLEGSIANRYVQGEAYVLSNGTEGIGLYKAELNKLENTAFLNNANKVYLPVAEGASLTAAFYGFNWDGTTAIEDVKGENGEVKTIYDLTGRKVETISAPGIYIIGGKKVLVK